MRAGTIFLEREGNMKVTCFCLCIVMTAVLAGCAGIRDTATRDIVYDPPPPPTSFDLDMYLTAKYMDSSHPLRIEGQDYTFDGAIAYIRRHETAKSGSYTVLLHGLNGNDVLLGAYMCFVVLMHESGAVGYGSDGNNKPSAPKMTIPKNQYANLLQKCREP